MAVETSELPRVTYSPELMEAYDPELIPKHFKELAEEKRLSFSGPEKPLKFIYILCPVRQASDEEIEAQRKHVAMLEREGHEVFWPPRDNGYEAIDPTGAQISLANSAGIQMADEVHVFWSKTSRGSLFDLGMAFAEHKPLVKNVLCIPEREVV